MLCIIQALGLDDTVMLALSRRFLKWDHCKLRGSQTNCQAYTLFLHIAKAKISVKKNIHCRVEELASTEIGFKDSDGLKPFHLAVFFIVLSAGLWFLAVLLYFTADIKLQQASFIALFCTEDFWAVHPTPSVISFPSFLSVFL